MNRFLQDAGWADADQQPLAGDASGRRYIRLRKGDDSAILMIDPEGDVDRFATLARHLISLGLSAPRILAEDASAGLLLIEDLGDGLLVKLAGDAAEEKRLYIAAVDALIALHDHPPPTHLPKATPEVLAQMTHLAFDTYAPAMTGGAAPDGQPAMELLQGLLTQYAGKADVMILRDYHAENILWLPKREGPARAGLLDFQDALQGHRAYDLISLLHDARRDVGKETREASIRHYITATGVDAEGFRTALAVLGAQRNMRILGVFARLATEKGKPHYLDLIPRVWRDLQISLAHPALAALADTLTLPEPTPGRLTRLKSLCPTP
ncbi:MAG: phosphotransferase [Paracoccaceae bacterium]|nr:phosphotransferase [Paracoccaceae bacterium]